MGIHEELLEKGYEVHSSSKIVFHGSSFWNRTIEELEKKVVSGEIVSFAMLPTAHAGGGNTENIKDYIFYVKKK